VSYRGDVAIDNVVLLNNECPPPGSCDFEDDTCTWMNLRGSVDQFDWTRHNGETSSFTTGPLSDHTEGTVKGLMRNLSLYEDSYNINLFCFPKTAH